MQFDALHYLGSPSNMYENLFYGWKNHHYLFGLGSNVKFGDYQIWGLALFVQKTQITYDSIKLHNMVADKKNPTAWQESCDSQNS